MAAAAAIFNRHMAAEQAPGQTLTGKVASPMDTSTSGTSGASDSSGDSATISANDFLTLLVTEMQNQDPTSDTDPNEYINQLVQVNSLEQLIDINQTLTTAVGTPASTIDGSASDQSVTAGPKAEGAVAPSSGNRDSSQRVERGAFSFYRRLRASVLRRAFALRAI